GQLSEETGIREFVVGTGGGTPHAFEQELVAGSSERFTDVFGVLEMELRPREYAWRFVSAEGRVLDQGAGECHR
ncbi:MAG: alkaline phosphatase, partial [Actinomycetota bacterium]